MNNRDAEIERLSAELTRLFCDDELDEARQVVHELAELLASETAESPEEYVHSWSLVFEVQGNIGEAIRIEDIELARKRQEIECGAFDSYPQLIPDEVKYLQDGLFLQAERYDKLGNREEAIKCLREVLSLGQRFGMEPEADVYRLLGEITSK